MKSVFVISTSGEISFCHFDASEKSVFVISTSGEILANFVRKGCVSQFFLEISLDNILCSGLEDVVVVNIAFWAQKQPQGVMPKNFFGIFNINTGLVAN